MRASGNLSNEYQLPVEVSAALKQRTSSGPTHLTVYKTPKFESRFTQKPNSLTKSSENLHSMLKFDNPVDRREHSITKSNVTSIATDRVVEHRLEKHRGTHSLSNILNPRVTQFDKSSSLRKSSDESSVGSGQPSIRYFPTL